MNITSRRGRMALFALVTVVALLTAACTFREDAGQTDRPADTTFDIAIGIEPDTLDPVGTTTTTVANVIDYAVETLTTINREGELQPQLAESWEVSEDGLAITIRLKEGVTFHDGTPFDAQAVKFNLDRLMDPKVSVPIRAPYEALESTEVVDDTTVELKLKEPAPALMDAFSWTTTAMLSPESIDTQGNAYDKIVHPVGTGPYTFQTYRKGDRVVVEKFGDYWGEEPFYETVNFRIVPEAASRESLLRAGQADMIILPPVSDIEALENADDTNVLLAPSDRSIFIAINNNEITDERVRQAMNYAVDKQALIDDLLFGAADVLDAPMDDSLTGYCEIGGYEYDPERARELLQQAGAQNLEVTVGTPTGRYLQDSQVSEAISGYLREVGIDAKLQTMDWASYIGEITTPAQKQRFDMHLLGWAPSFLDASMQMDQFESSQHPPDGLATSFYENPEVDRLIAQADQEVDEQRREELYCEASEIVWEDAPWIFLWSQKFPIAYSADVENVSFLPNEKFYAVYARPAG